MHVLIVEDQPNDLRNASAAALAAGFSEVDAKSSAMVAKAHLEKGLEGKEPLPAAIILDLDLGYDSGFELLRFWHGNPQLAKIPLIVWTIMGDHYREICRMFHVKAYVSKSDDISVLRTVLSGLLRASA